MAILEKEVVVDVTGNVKYYESLGYIIPKKVDNNGKERVPLGTKIKINVNDLPKNSNFKVTKICDICKDCITTSYFAILKQRKNNSGLDVCRSCSIRKKVKEKAKNNSLEEKFPELTKEFIKCVNESYNQYTPKNLNIKSNLKAYWKCKKCEYIWIARISDRTNGSNCPACYGRVVSDKNRLSLLYPNLVKEWHPIKNGELKPNEVTYASHKIVWWKCENMHEWKTPVYSRTTMKSNCPICSESKGERRIREWLDITKIKYESQKEFEGLTGVANGNLSYDFYLPEQNMLIEYQGKQHEEFIEGLHKSKKQFNIQQEHDRRKREFAKNKRFTLLEIWYWDFDRVEEILENNIIKRRG